MPASCYSAVARVRRLLYVANERLVFLTEGGLNVFMIAMREKISSQILYFIFGNFVLHKNQT